MRVLENLGCIVSSTEGTDHANVEQNLERCPATLIW
jgi:hypothetical protein